MGLAWSLRETANQAAGLLFPKPAADELKILPQTRSALQHSTVIPSDFQPIFILADNTSAVRVF
jgi:hypothetical protein